MLIEMDLAYIEIGLYPFRPSFVRLMLQSALCPMSLARYDSEVDTNDFSPGGYRANNFCEHCHIEYLKRGSFCVASFSDTSLGHIPITHFSPMVVKEN